MNMRDIGKYQGIIPAFYACYGENGEVDEGRVEQLTDYMVRKGVKGVYVGGSSGECIYQSVDDRKRTLERVVKSGAGKLTIIAHVACNNTADSRELAAHAQSLGVDAIAAIPPIYFHLPEYAVAEYWNNISAAAPDTDFIIYNIPQLAGVALTMPLFHEMKKNSRVAAVKNSSMPTQDIQMFKAEGGEGFAVLNGPDEQLVAGLAIGADGGIGGTYGVMPELYLKIMELVKAGKLEDARKVQYAANEVIYAMCACHGNLYGVIKEILKIREGIDIGGVRKPLPSLIPDDMAQVKKCADMIDKAISQLA